TPGALKAITKKYSPAIVTWSGLHYEGGGLVHLDIEAPPSCVRDVVKDVVSLLKNCNIDDLKECKKRAKENIIRTEKKIRPSFNAAVRAGEIFAVVEKHAVLNAIDNVTSSQVKAAVERILANISIGCVGNIDSVPCRSEIHNW
ncbi:hypothetical protein PMAYCL1PPCAC_20434, partial [Pristionchus mayeri]